MSERLEELLPSELSLNDALEVLRDDFDLAIATVRQDQQDILNVVDELDNEPRLLWRFSGNFSRIISTKEDIAMEDIIPVYRAVCFALQTVSAVAPDGVVGVPIGDYFGKFHEDMKLANQICDDTYEYLSTRPHVEELIASYSDEIDSNYHHRPEVRITMGFMLMLCERATASKYLADQINT